MCPFYHSKTNEPALYKQTFKYVNTTLLYIIKKNYSQICVVIYNAKVLYSIINLYNILKKIARSSLCNMALQKPPMMTSFVKVSVP